MSYRSAIQRLVGQAAKQKTKLKGNHLQPGGGGTLSYYPSSSFLRPSLPHLSRVFDEEKKSYSGWGSCGSDQWEERITGDHVSTLMRSSFTDVGPCSLNRSSDGTQLRTNLASEIHDSENRNNDYGGGRPRPGRSEVSPADAAIVGFSGKVWSQSYGRFGGFGGVSRGPVTRCGYESARFYSSSASATGEKLVVGATDQLDTLTALADSAATSGTRAISEVAAVVGDCSYPTAAIQYVIEGVHLTTGLPWWVSIAATTVAIRILVLPILVYQMKATARLTLMRPELEKLTNHIKENNYDPKVVEENQARMKLLFQEHKTNPLSPVLGAFVQAPIFMCFFFAIRNMAERVDSFREGGALWFTDLSTPDSLFIMPVLSGAMFLLTVELGATDVFKQPGVKGALGIPDVSHLAKREGPIAPVLTFSQPPRLPSKTPGPQDGEKAATYVHKKRRA
ncbi:hypothetical protein R1sor_016727 [Riccia sorocarpa]|uniref:Membrane insertase YidC/Oxa/ALB C-terminal domain-containing protein n=1 Tax=Riccia sorocarpa TaxID=122646 RepID=A0ABD3HG94_9MARC